MKVYLTKYAREKHLDEVDVGFNVTAAASRDFDKVREEMKQIVEAAGGEVKVIPMPWMVKFSLRDRGRAVPDLCRSRNHLRKNERGYPFWADAGEHIGMAV